MDLRECLIGSCTYVSGVQGQGPNQKGILGGRSIDGSLSSETG